MNKLRWIIIVLILALLTSFVALSEYDLEDMSAGELNALKKAVSAELDSNHSISSKEEDKVKGYVKGVVEAIFKERDIEVSWAWFDYEYTKDWNYYSFQSHIDYEDENKKDHEDHIDAFVMLDDEGNFETIWLKVGNSIEIEALSLLPENKAFLAFNERFPKVSLEELGYGDISQYKDPTENKIIIRPTDTPTPEPTPEPTDTPTPEPTPEPTDTPTPEPTPEPTNTPTPSPTPGPSPTAEPISNGSKGEAVKELQAELVVHGYEIGTIDGVFGNKTKKAIIDYQHKIGLPETGIADAETQRFLYTLPADITFLLFKSNDNSGSYHLPACPVFDEYYDIEAMLYQDKEALPSFYYGSLEYTCDSREDVEKAGFMPCRVCQPDNVYIIATATPIPTVVAAVSTPTPDNGKDYVLNTNTMKFHKPSCGSVKQMKAKNRWDYHGTREEIISWGYTPCKKCNP